MPIVAALWQTCYGQAILVKIGLLASRWSSPRSTCSITKPRLVAAGERPARRRAGRLAAAQADQRRDALVVPARSSPQPCSRASLHPPALAKEELRARDTSVPAASPPTVHQDGYTLQVLVSPNKAVAPNSFALKLTKNGVPVRGADVTLGFTSSTCRWPTRNTSSPRRRPASTPHPAPALVMVGHWALSFNVTPKNGPPFTALVVDHATG